MTLFDLGTPELTLDFSAAVVQQINYQTARRVIEENHYLGTAGSTAVSYGMFLDGVMAGVLTLGTTVAGNAASICGPEHALNVLELTRLFVYDWAGKNAESSFIGRVLRSLRPYAQEQGGLILLSYADTGAGHVGTIYQATNWIYTGSSVPSHIILDDGTVVHSRVASDARRNRSSAGLQRVNGSLKHRYVIFIGDRRQVRKLRADLRWPILPYPKNEKKETPP